VSFIQSTLKCDGCGYEMNVAFGIVGRTIIADPPKACPKCGGKLTKIANGWHAQKGTPHDI
jgi:predicted nucleic acid-binding Zn ribbon protein